MTALSVRWMPIGHALDPVDVGRFVRNVDVSGGLNACWPWTGNRNPMTGYGRTRRFGEPVAAHRLALEIALGRPIRPGFLACHTCDVKPCCNPRHLYEGTPADNTRDAIERGLLVPPSKVPQPRLDQRLRGERVHTARLTASDVRRIRSAPASTPTAVLARAFGVGRTAIRMARTGQSWSHLR